MILHGSPIFGPVCSRRLGVSLGVNLLPGDGKLCSFDCVYCECGLNALRQTHTAMPTRNEVCEALDNRLWRMRRGGEKLDVITFAGNGEPTLHPQFPEIVDDALRLRNLHFPEAKLSALSNSTQAYRPEVRDALLKLDNPIMKLDTVSPEYIRLVNRPQGNFNVESVVEILAAMGQSIVVQTMFMSGNMNGHNVDNTGDEYVEPWIEALRRISPKQVMIYTIARKTPYDTLEKASPRRLGEIAAKVRERGITCSVSY